jgi:hypothetical protein
MAEELNLDYFDLGTFVDYVHALKQERDALRAQLPSQGGEAVSAADGDRPGYDALWLSFGMSRAAFVVLPRVMMHDMPDAWQADMARLLDEWEATWVNQPNISSRVQIVDAEGRLMKTPAWVLNYRHPDREQLAAMKVPRSNS